MGLYFYLCLMWSRITCCGEQGEWLESSCLPLNSSASQNHEDKQNAAKLSLVPSVSSVSPFQPNVPSLHPFPGNEQYSFHESLTYIMKEKQKPGKKQICISTDCVLSSLDLQVPVRGETRNNN